MKEGKDEKFSGQFSLLWRDPAHRSDAKYARDLPKQTIDDLELEAVLEHIFPEYLEKPKMRKNFYRLCQSGDTIRYRQDILEDLKEQPEFTAAIEVLLPDLQNLSGSIHMGQDKTPLFKAAYLCSELESFIRCIGGLSAAFERFGKKLKSEGFARLRQFVEKTRQHPDYELLSKTLPDIAAEIRGVRSVTIGVNLDNDLRPVEACLVSVNDKRYGKDSPGILNRLLGGQEDPMEKIGRLHTPPLKNIGLGRDDIKLDPDIYGYAQDAMMIPLFEELSGILNRTSQSVVRALKKFKSLQSVFFVDLGSEFYFYLSLIRFMKSAGEGGLPFCKAEILPADEGICDVEDNYSIHLAVQNIKSRESGSAVPVVTNNLFFDGRNRIFVLTGPNKGGKTVYTQAAGVLFAFAQSCGYVPGSRARVSPVDSVYTHYQLEERFDRNTGRLGEEAARLKNLFAELSRDSLLLMNESFSSTSSGESLYIAEDVVRALRKLGTRCIFATHLHELAKELPGINAESDSGYLAASLVSMISEEILDDGLHRRTYKIVPSLPMGHSYAQEIAAKYGISYDQLDELIRRKGEAR